ncbi:tRNA uridine-5-carboxymethylaminomethyl(34) synthesis GTPase MnmE [Occallatibacter riparius]|uniref:tRNA modification GTPase MnmE n=1 Tax=Occallatibacter riparius TaxID=1002689 RepID=A0A9J7BSL6_9BACT|nr:tRNA uridine-5-carboxymethylaminomethyl(34) synthesis GTPase MnmE [Occallatibacter riparius]UWZ85883.1 tRNA uridine-5-carboxymethylaminomethyl(34) synthesis GTPase MnmE [Occallatibacter riparius]
MADTPQNSDPKMAPVLETIAAISTPPGRGGIGIVRLSGPEAASMAAQLVRLQRPLEHGRARLADVLDAEGETAERIDEAVVTYFAAPNSYTADDLVEIAAHGSPVVLDLLLRRAIGLGARLAEPGEFTQRAFLAGRIDLTQAEAVRDLIDAQTLTQARQAASQMGGALSRRAAPVKQDLVELIALLEAGIDFAEDDVDVTPQQEIARRIDELAVPLSALEASFSRGRIVHDGLTLAIVGRPNAGKSSLFNRLVERERAIVTPSPGTTRDTVSERISLDGIPLELVDTAGLREAHDVAEQLGIARSREALADAALVLIVLDATQPLNEEERDLLRAVQGRPALVAMNKRDLAEARSEESAALDGVPVIATSALTGEGVAELRSRIVALASGGAASESGMLTNLRQHQAVTTALEALADAKRANESSIPHEMILLDLYRGLWALDSLTGQTTADDILQLIFSTFCIGK